MKRISKENKISGALLGVYILSTGLSFGKTGGSDAGNGGGIAEKRVLFAYQNLEKYLDMCLLTTLCRLDEKEASTLKEIRSSLKQERVTKDQIEFSAGHTNPEFFKIDGQIRVAKTGDDIGSKIDVNTDLLYWQDEAGVPGSINLPTAVSILVHELGHHHGIKDHTYLDQIGTKLQTVLSKQVVQTSIWNGDIQFTVIQNNVVLRDEDKKNIHELDQVLIGYANHLEDLTEKVAAAIHCPKSSQKVMGLRLYNLHEERGLVHDEKKDITHKPLRAWYILSCEEGKETDHGDVSISLGLRRDRKTKQAVYRPEESTFRQESCLADAKFCK